MTISIKNTPIAHLIKNTHGDLQRVTINDTDAEMAAIEGNVVTTANLDELVDALPPLVAYDFMDQATWRSVGLELKAMADHIKAQPNPYDRFPQMMPQNTFDMDKEITSGRLSALMDIYDPLFDLEDYVELNEIWFAQQNLRPLQAELVSSRARFMHWGEPYIELDDEQLEDIMISVHECAAQNASERALYGDSAPGSQRSDRLGRLEEAEITYYMKHFRAGESQVENEDQDDDLLMDGPY